MDRKFSLTRSRPAVPIGSASSGCSSRTSMRSEHCLSESTRKPLSPSLFRRLMLLGVTRDHRLTFAEALALGEPKALLDGPPDDDVAGGLNGTDPRHPSLLSVQSRAPPPKPNSNPFQRKPKATLTQDVAGGCHFLIEWMCSDGADSAASEGGRTGVPGGGQQGRILDCLVR